jgi:hypothetical protein
MSCPVFADTGGAHIGFMYAPMVKIIRLRVLRGSAPRADIKSNLVVASFELAFLTKPRHSRASGNPVRKQPIPERWRSGFPACAGMTFGRERPYRANDTTTSNLHATRRCRYIGYTLMNVL